MNKIIKLIFFVFLFDQSSFARERITLLVGEWPPFIGKKLKNHGFGSQIIKRAFEKKDIKVKIRFTTWENAFDWTKKGKNGDGTFFWSKTKEREKIMDINIDKYQKYVKHAKKNFNNVTNILNMSNK